MNLAKHNTIWDKFSVDIKNKIDSELVYNKKFLETKLKSYSDETTDFHNKEIPKAGSNCICLAVTTIDSALNRDENYYPKAFLKECKYIEKKLFGILLKI